MNKANYESIEQENYMERQIYASNNFIENNPSLDQQKSAIVIVYQDENGKQYLDAETIAALVQTIYYEYDYPSGHQFIVSAETLRTKATPVAPDGATSIKRVLPDFSSLLPYDEEFDLYEVNIEQLDELLSNFEKNNPQLSVQTQIKYIFHNINYKNNFAEKDDFNKYNNQDKVAKTIKDIVNVYQNNKNTLLKDDEKSTKRR